MITELRRKPIRPILRRAASATNSAIDGEDGHGLPLLGSLVLGIGTIALGIGAANGTGWLAVAGGIVAFLGSALAVVLSHLTIDYDMYRRLDALEGKE